MKVDPKIIWLASYPKSGNTWTRLFLHALKTGNPISNLNELDSTDGISSAKWLPETYMGIDIDDVPQGQIQKNRAATFELWNEDLEEEVIVKSHDTPFYQGHRIIPDTVTKKVVLIVRNPFDLVASWANHCSSSIEQSVFYLCNDAAILAKGHYKFNSQLAQHTSSWSSFYRSWKNAFHEKITIFRYEDLVSDPLNTFSKMVNWLEWDKSEEEIQKAIVASQFKNLKKIEKEKGFVEKPKKTASFFRSGKVGNWRNEITMDMADHLINCHYHTLLELGYIDKNKKILL